MSVPSWRTLIHTETAIIQLAPTGITKVEIKPQARQTLSNAIENMAAAIEVCGPKKRPILVDISRSHPLEPDARRYYSGKVLIDNFLAMALLVDITPVGRMMANVYLRIARPMIPTRLFFEEPYAEKWLMEFLS